MHIRGSLNHFRCLKRIGFAWQGLGSGSAAVSYSDLIGDKFSSFPQVLSVLPAMAIG